MLSRATVQQSAKTFKFRIGYAKTLLDLTSTPTKIVMIRVTHADFDPLIFKSLNFIGQSSLTH